MMQGGSQHFLTVLLFDPELPHQVDVLNSLVDNFEQSKL